MSQNFNNTNNPSTGGAGTGATDAGTTRDTSASTGTSFGAGSLSSTGAATGAAPARDGIAGTAQEYGQKIADAASQAKDYMSDKLSPAVDKFRELQQKDYGQIADDAKEYAKQNPGQTILISAAAGFLLGLLLRNTRR
ncbi:MAG: C-terminal glycine zipper region [Acidobacteriota bacterium]|jgi:ElaB/YqjD/DUF883 family membrane-anchored ribosome-binding protein|nr:C-terminal glycine zipper region [Acidobacteriota bacterium]